MLWHQRNVIVCHYNGSINDIKAKWYISVTLWVVTPLWFGLPLYLQQALVCMWHWRKTDQESHQHKQNYQNIQSITNVNKQTHGCSEWNSPASQIEHPNSLKYVMIWRWSSNCQIILKQTWSFSPQHLHDDSNVNKKHNYILLLPFIHSNI